MPFQRAFREDAAAVHLDLEGAARRLDQLDLRLGEGLVNLGRQTGGPGLVVSDDAVFDRDTHAENDSGA